MRARQRSPSGPGPPLSDRTPHDPTINSISTTVAVAGEDYVIIAASTRLSTGYSILTRDASKFVQL